MTEVKPMAPRGCCWSGYYVVYFCSHCLLGLYWVLVLFAVLYVLSSVAVVPLGKKELVTLNTSIVLLMSCSRYYGAMDKYAVRNCSISWSNSLSDAIWLSVRSASCLPGHLKLKLNWF